MMRSPRAGSGAGRTIVFGCVAALLAAACSEVSPAELSARYDASDSGATIGTLAPPTTTESAAVDGDSEPAENLGNVPSPDGRPARAEPLDVAWGDCPFVDDFRTVECGIVAIPQDGDVEPVEIAFARYRGLGLVEADPVVYLHGGPGGALLAEANLFARSIVDPFIENRDVIVYDQRGAGQSSPLPECFEAWDLDEAFFSDSVGHASLREAYVEVLASCGERLGRRTDVDLSDYASAVHADDLFDLTRALGYDEFNIYGNSYGTRLAQTVLRDHPDPVRAVILSGVYPIEENLIGSTPAAFESAIRLVGDACAAEPDCRGELPDLVASLEQRVAALDADPPTINIPVDDQSTYPFVLAGDDFINILHGLLYTADGAALIPDLLIDLEAGDLDRLTRVAPDGIYNTSDVGAYLGVQCREEAPFTTPEEFERADRDETVWDRINLPPGLLSADLIEVCDAWDAIGEADPLENLPVTWTQPTLLLSGGFDPITPPPWAAGMADRLPNAALAFSADRGHDADEGICASGLMTSFIDDPDPALDTSCTLEWDLPYLTATNVRLQEPNAIELTESIFDIDPTADVEWIDMLLPTWVYDLYDAEEVYWRNLDIYDSTVIVLRSGKFDPAELTAYLPFDVLDVDFVETELPDNVGAGWIRRVYDTVDLDIVTYVSEGTPAMNVSVIATEADLAELEKTAIIPMINSVVLG